MYKFCKNEVSADNKVLFISRFIDTVTKGQAFLNGLKRLAVKSWLVDFRT